MFWLQQWFRTRWYLKTIVVILSKDVIICSVLWVNKEISLVVIEWAKVWPWCLLWSRGNSTPYFCPNFGLASSNFLLPCFVQTVCSGHWCVLFEWNIIAKFCIKKYIFCQGRPESLRKMVKLVVCYAIDISPRKHFSDPLSFLSEYWNVFICRLVQPWT